MPIAASLPANRVGTPWQRRHSIRTWLATLMLMHRHPVGCWSSVRVFSIWQHPTLSTADGLRQSRAYPTALAGLNCLVASVVFAILLAIAGRSAALLVSALMISPVLAIVLFMAVAIEARGIRFFANRRGGRVDPLIAWTVVAHASFALWALPVALVIEALVFPALLDLVETIRPATYPWWYIRGMSVLIAVTVGILPFQYLTAQGIRSMKFANRGR